MDARSLNQGNSDRHRRPPPDFSDQLEALKEVLAEAEDLAAEFASAMRMEAKRAQFEAERLSRELNDA